MCLTAKEFPLLDSYVVVSERDVSRDFERMNPHKEAEAKVHSVLIKDASLECALSKKKQLERFLGKCRIARLEFIDGVIHN